VLTTILDLLFSCVVLHGDNHRKSLLRQSSVLLLIAL
jgi:hypothetical protein